MEDAELRTASKVGLIQVPEIASFDKGLYDNFTLINSFADYADGRPPNKRRLIIARLLLAGIFIGVVRWFTLLMSDSQQVWERLGDVHHLFGDRLMLNFCLLFCWLSVFILMFAYHYEEIMRRNYWVKPLAALVTGVHNPKGIGLTVEALKYFRRSLAIVPYFMLTMRAWRPSTPFISPSCRSSAVTSRRRWCPA